jgi:hypothetical protein
MQEKIASQQQSAKHLAARAVMAYRAGFPVALLSNERPSGIVCDWKGLRDSFHNDAKLLGRAFAFFYVGSIVDQAINDPISDELRKELVSDMSSALDARQHYQAFRFGLTPDPRSHFWRQCCSICWKVCVH